MNDRETQPIDTCLICNGSRREPGGRCKACGGSGLRVLDEEDEGDLPEDVEREVRNRVHPSDGGNWRG